MDNDQNSKILASNGLYYVMPKPLSTTLNRTFKTEYSQRQVYGSGETIVFDLNTSGIVDPDCSFMKFKLRVGTNAISINTGSAVNIFREIRIQSRNGTELDRVEHLNDWAHWYMRNCISKELMDQRGGLFGFGSGVTPYAVGDHEFCVPLAFLSGLFRPYVKGQKMPQSLLAGARVEIQLEKPEKAFQSTAAFTIDVVNPELHLMTHTCNDSTLKVLSEVSANNGLEYFYPRVFTVVETSANNNVNYQIKKAVSQCTSVVTVPKLTANQALSTADSFIGVSVAGFSKFQYRLGSNYYPNQIVDSAPEAYAVSSQVCHKLVDSVSPISSYNSWGASGDLHVSVPLQTDSSISSSGLAVNNSATIALEYESTDGQSKTFYTFMHYNALARCFLSQITCKI